jgi:hypothetical protein
MQHKAGTKQSCLFAVSAMSYISAQKVIPDEERLNIYTSIRLEFLSHFMFPHYNREKV